MDSRGAGRNHRTVNSQRDMCSFSGPSIQSQACSQLCLLLVKWCNFQPGSGLRKVAGGRGEHLRSRVTSQLRCMIDSDDTWTIYKMNPLKLRRRHQLWQIVEAREDQNGFQDPSSLPVELNYMRRRRHFRLMCDTGDGTKKSFPGKLPDKKPREQWPYRPATKSFAKGGVDSKKVRPHVKYSPSLLSNELFLVAQHNITWSCSHGPVCFAVGRRQKQSIHSFSSHYEEALHLLRSE